MSKYVLYAFMGIAAIIAPLAFMAATGQALQRNVALTIIFIICVMGPALAIGLTGYSSIGALGRNPSAAPKILTAMTITLLSVEGVAIVAFLIVWQLFSAQ
jgi:F0F1-type ATP synthase membrane subunit c/vacuolar-type H+-ATPase subunit K